MFWCSRPFLDPVLVGVPRGSWIESSRWCQWPFAACPTPDRFKRWDFMDFSSHDVCRDERYVEVVSWCWRWFHSYKSFHEDHHIVLGIESWNAKRVSPGRILGRHSSAVKESDSVYSRDLSFGPFRALERVFVMIREKSFAPDGQRSQFFPMTPQPGAAPAFPPTPVFQAFAPKTPVASFIKVPDEKLPEAELKSPTLEVKEEMSEADAMSGLGVALSISETIEISSDSESASSSEAESDLFSSEDERKGEVTSSKMPRFSRVPESPGMNEVWMQNPSTRSCMQSFGMNHSKVEFTSRSVVGELTKFSLLLQFWMIGRQSAVFVSKGEDSQKLAKPNVACSKWALLSKLRHPQSEGEKWREVLPGWSVQSSRVLNLVILFKLRWEIRCDVSFVFHVF